MNAHTMSVIQFPQSTHLPAVLRHDHLVGEVLEARPQVAIVQRDARVQRICGGRLVALLAVAHVIAGQVDGADGVQQQVSVHHGRQLVSAGCGGGHWRGAMEICVFLWVRLRCARTRDSA